MKRLFFFNAFSTLKGIPTNQSQHFLFKNQHNCHHSITYLPTSTTFSHNSSTITPTTKFISFSIPPELISSSLHLQHPRTPSSLSHLLQIIHINYLLLEFFTNLSSLSTHAAQILLSNSHPKAPIRSPIILQAMLASSSMKGCVYIYMCAMICCRLEGMPSHISC